MKMTRKSLHDGIMVRKGWRYGRFSGVLSSFFFFPFLPIFYFSFFLLPVYFLIRLRASSPLLTFPPPFPPHPAIIFPASPKTCRIAESAGVREGDRSFGHRKGKRREEEKKGSPLYLQRAEPAWERSIS